MTRRTSATLRVEHREARADLVGEREEVELDAELAVVAPLGLLEAVQVLVERGLRLPRGAVDALEHRALLVAPPVRARDLRELERAEPLGRRHVRAAAQVDELVARRSTTLRYTETPTVAAGLARVLARRVAGVDLLDDLALVGLVGERSRARASRSSSSRTNGSSALHDLAHPRLDALEVVVGEVLRRPGSSKS